MAPYSRRSHYASMPSNWAAAEPYSQARKVSSTAAPTPRRPQGTTLRRDLRFVDTAYEEAWLSAQARGQRGKDVLFSITFVLLAAFGVARSASGTDAAWSCEHQRTEGLLLHTYPCTATTLHQALHVLRHYAWYVWGPRMLRLHYWTTAWLCGVPALVVACTLLAIAAEATQEICSQDQSQAQGQGQSREQEHHSHGQQQRRDSSSLKALYAIAAPCLSSFSRTWPLLREVLAAALLTGTGLLLAAHVAWPGHEAPQSGWSVLCIACPRRPLNQVLVALFFVEGLRARLCVMLWPLLLYKVLACGLRCTVYAPAPYGVAQGSMDATGLGCAGSGTTTASVLLQGILLGWLLPCGYVWVSERHARRAWMPRQQHAHAHGHAQARADAGQMRKGIYDKDGGAAAYLQAHQAGFLETAASSAPQSTDVEPACSTSALYCSPHFALSLTTKAHVPHGMSPMDAAHELGAAVCRHLDKCMAQTLGLHESSRGHAGEHTGMMPWGEDMRMVGTLSAAMQGCVVLMQRVMLAETKSAQKNNPAGSPAGLSDHTAARGQQVHMFATCQGLTAALTAEGWSLIGHGTRYLGIQPAGNRSSSQGSANGGHSSDSGGDGNSSSTGRGSGSEEGAAAAAAASAFEGLQPVDATDTRIDDPSSDQERVDMPEVPMSSLGLYLQPAALAWHADRQGMQLQHGAERLTSVLRVCMAPEALQRLLVGPHSCRMRVVVCCGHAQLGQVEVVPAHATTGCVDVSVDLGQLAGGAHEVGLHLQPSNGSSTAGGTSQTRQQLPVRVLQAAVAMSPCSAQTHGSAQERLVDCAVALVVPAPCAHDVRRLWHSMQVEAGCRQMTYHEVTEAAATAVDTTLSSGGMPSDLARPEPGRQPASGSIIEPVPGLQPASGSSTGPSGFMSRYCPRCAHVYRAHMEPLLMDMALAAGAMTRTREAVDAAEAMQQALLSFLHAHAMHACAQLCSGSMAPQTHGSAQPEISTAPDLRLTADDDSPGPRDTVASSGATTGTATTAVAGSGGLEGHVMSAGPEAQVRAAPIAAAEEEAEAAPEHLACSASETAADADAPSTSQLAPWTHVLWQQQQQPARDELHYLAWRVQQGVGKACAKYYGIICVFGWAAALLKSTHERRPSLYLYTLAVSWFMCILLPYAVMALVGERRVLSWARGRGFDLLSALLVAGMATALSSLLQALKHWPPLETQIELNRDSEQGILRLSAIQVCRCLLPPFVQQLRPHVQFLSSLLQAPSEVMYLLPLYGGSKIPTWVLWLHAANIVVMHTLLAGVLDRRARREFSSKLAAAKKQA